MFITINKNKIICVFLIFVLLACSLMSMHLITTKSTGNTPNNKICIVIDAGHGGIDGGAVGKTLIEKDINLVLAKKLEKYLVAYGIEVVLTRTNSDGLYDENAESLKKSDMENRKKIIENANANIVISLHQNSFVTNTLRGAQCFYQLNNKNGKALADAIQNELINKLPFARKSSNFGDYFILNCSQAVSVLIECAFITNPLEEELLSTPDYQDRICYSIFCGIIKYLESIN